MKEIEILVEVFENVEKVKNALNNCKYTGLKHTIDEYYYDPKREELKPDNNNNLMHCLRLRETNNKYSITYKDDVFEGSKWLYSNEYETEIKDLEVLKTIFEKLGLKKFITIDNKKESYSYGEYEIVVEDVKDLGLFMEVEYCTNDNIDVKKKKEEIQSFIDSLNLNVSEELNMGKPEMYMKKHNINIE